MISPGSAARRLQIVRPIASAAARSAALIATAALLILGLLPVVLGAAATLGSIAA